MKRMMGHYLKIVLGGAVFAAGFRFFLLPNEIVTGGVSGLAMILNHLTGVPVGLFMLLCNVPVYLFAWRGLGRRFFIDACVGLTVVSVLVDVFALFSITATRDLLLAAVYGGVIMGTGLGLILSTGASSGGSDLLARLLRKKRPDLSIGQLILAIDFCVIVLGAVVYRRYDSAMYAVIGIFLSNRVIDLILYGSHTAKVVYIITDEAPVIAEQIMTVLGRGVTALRGQGAYSGREKTVLMCAIKQRQQITELNRIAYRVDPGAFIMIVDAREVLGAGFGALE